MTSRPAKLQIVNQFIEIFNANKVGDEEEINFVTELR
jgi:hypothetical protein